MKSEIVHRKVYRAFEVFVNRAFFAVVREIDFLVEERDIAAFADILVNGREEPQSVIGTIARVSRFTDIFGVVGSVFVSRIVSVLDKRKSRAVCNLCREHKYYLFFCHFGREVDNSLNILYGVAVAETVAQTAVNKRRRT